MRERGAKGEYFGLWGRKLHGLEKLHNEEGIDFVRVPKLRKEMVGICGMCGEEKKCLQGA